MLSCSSSCYDMDFKTNRDIVADCIEHCNKPVRNISNFMQNELDTLQCLCEFQAQLNRCALTCYDKAYQKYGPDPATYNATEKKAYNKQIERFVTFVGLPLHVKQRHACEVNLPNSRIKIVKREHDCNNFSCICACVDDHIKLLPNIRKRIVDTIKREKE
ncbi:unnamed protein product [Gongylonema pulchrum]|uniref:Protein FAM136A n=1 Tax=Gongylonema pulchrum TaxID=637853 RepID=A0A183F0E6_9BILA|nr:unnamed protein product [Gongylonema pulchrum]